jgi:hypothetical protein
MTHPPKSQAHFLIGDLRLLHDLAVIERVLDGDPVPARTRLEHELGGRFAAEVRRSLADPMPKAA